MDAKIQDVRLAESANGNYTIVEFEETEDKEGNILMVRPLIFTHTKELHDKWSKRIGKIVKAQRL